MIAIQRIRNDHASVERVTFHDWRKKAGVRDVTRGRGNM
jgi:hypothetical protein